MKSAQLQFVFAALGLASIVLMLMSMVGPMNLWITTLAMIAGVVCLMLALVHNYRDMRDRNNLRQKELVEAERRVFRSDKASLQSAIADLDKSISLSDGKTEAANSPSLPALAEWHSAQIKGYQDEARGRASWSFTCAWIAMFAGFGFMGWGGWYCITTDKVAAGASVAAIGGAVSAFLTATFLRIYSISIEQLHIYFQQPVINDHIVNAQRVVDLIKDDTKRYAMYEEIARKLLTRVEMLPVAPKAIEAKE